jgi:hypothetical protein
MATARQKAAARRNIKIRMALGKQGARVAKEKRRNNLSGDNT